MLRHRTSVVRGVGRDNRQIAIIMKKKICTDCGVKEGESHVEGCDNETCTSCGIQRIQCSCPDHDKKKAAFGNLKDIISDFWIENYCGKPEGEEYPHCLLCSDTGIKTGRRNMNSGIITTLMGQKLWCVCPNGRAMANQSKTKGPR